jgi:hypothetical protein
VVPISTLSRILVIIENVVKKLSTVGDTLRGIAVKGAQLETSLCICYVYHIHRTSEWDLSEYVLSSWENILNSRRFNSSFVVGKCVGIISEDFICSPEIIYVLLAMSV